MTIKAMTPWKWGRKVVPFREGFLSDAIFPEMNTLFDDMIRGFHAMPFRLEEKRDGFLNPHLDVVEKEKILEVSVELPGMSEKDIDLSINEGVLTIRGEKKHEEEKKEDNVYRRECAYGTFLRTIPLPAEVQEEKINAIFNKGILKITLPKTKETQKKIRHIAVKAA